MRHAAIAAAIVLAACGSGPSPGGSPGTGPPDGGTPPAAGACSVFPADNPWNRDVSQDPVDPSSDQYLSRMSPGSALHLDLGSTQQEYGIPYLVVPATQPLVPIRYGTDGVDYSSESDPGPFPIPIDAPIEGGTAANPDPSSGDRHVVVVQEGTCLLFELYNAVRDPAVLPTGFRCSASARWDLKVNAARPAGFTSADAAGLPIFPGLLRHEEAAAGEIRHALRFTTPQVQRAYVAPAGHCGSHADPSLPPYGLRVRLKAGFSLAPYAGDALVILKALKRYGLILADQGSPWYVTGTTHPAWADAIDQFRARPVPGSAFEVVQLGTVVRCP
jgi:hypothetical protein